MVGLLFLGVPRARGEYRAGSEQALRCVGRGPGRSVGTRSAGRDPELIPPATDGIAASPSMRRPASPCRPTIT